MNKVGVIGGGVVGLTCAIKIKEKYPQHEVTIYSKEFSPNTTSDLSGGIIFAPGTIDPKAIVTNRFRRHF